MFVKKIIKTTGVLIFFIIILMNYDYSVFANEIYNYDSRGNEYNINSDIYADIQQADSGWSVINTAPVEEAGNLRVSVAYYNLSTNIVSSFTPPGTVQMGLTYGSGYLWITCNINDRIYKISTTGNTVSSFNAPGSSPYGLAFDGIYLWNIDNSSNRIYKLTTSGSIISSISIPSSDPIGLAYDGTYLWYADETTDKIYKLSTSGNLITSFNSPGPEPYGLAFDGTYLWNADGSTGKIYKLDTAGNILGSFDSPASEPRGLAYDGTYLWHNGYTYSLSGGGTFSNQKVYKIDINDSPTEPRGLAANAVSRNKIMLRWTDQSDNEDGFEIERKKRGCNSSYQWSQIATVAENVNKFNDMDLDSDTQYSYRVRAYNSSGNSAYSNCGTTVSGITGTPSAPVNLVATWASSSRVDLTWDEWSSNVTEFKIYREINDSGSWTLLATTGPATLNYSDTSSMGNQSSTGYCYYVQACNSKGCSPPTYTVCIPFNPTGLIATDSNGKIVLNWSDNSDNERGFEIYRKTGDCSSSASWEKVKQAGIDRTTVSDKKDLVSGTKYSYKVRAYCRSWGLPYVYGYSAWSDCVSVTVNGGGSVRSKTVFLKGTWHFYYTLSQDTYHQYYKLDTITGKKNYEGGYYIYGTDEYGDAINACYWPDSGDWTLLDTSILFDRFYVFYTDGNTILKNSCYYQIQNQTDWSSCYTLHGSKTVLHDTDHFSLKSDLEEIEKDEVKAIEAQNMGRFNHEHIIDNSIQQKFLQLKQVLDSCK